MSGDATWGVLCERQHLLALARQRHSHSGRLRYLLLVARRLEGLTRSPLPAWPWALPAAFLARRSDRLHYPLEELKLTQPTQPARGAVLSRHGSDTPFRKFCASKLCCARLVARSAVWTHKTIGTSSSCKTF